MGMEREMEPVWGKGWEGWNVCWLRRQVRGPVRGCIQSDGKLRPWLFSYSYLLVLRCCREVKEGIYEDDMME